MSSGNVKVGKVRAVGFVEVVVHLPERRVRRGDDEFEKRLGWEVGGLKPYVVDDAFEHSKLYR
jgi:hypothetical protein